MPIDAWGLFRSMIEVVLIPLVAGVMINTLLEKSRHGDHCKTWIGVIGPVVSVALIVLVVASIVASRKQEIAQAGPFLFYAVFAMHGIGFTLGYLCAKCFGGDHGVCKAVSVEVGMQNSGLAASLAKKHFSDFVLAPVPAAISAVFHSLIGSFLVWCWNRREKSVEK